MSAIPKISREVLFYFAKSWAIQTGNPSDDFTCGRLADAASGAIALQKMNTGVRKAASVVIECFTQAYCEVLKPTDEQHARIVERFKVLVAEK